MSNNPCADALTSPYPAGPTTSQAFAKLTTSLATNNSQAVVNALQNMNIGTCSYTTSTQAAGFCAVDCLCCGGEASASQHAVGCSQVSIQAQLSVALNSNISCALSQIQNSVQNSTYQTNQLKIYMNDNTTSGTANFVLDQSNVVQGTVYNFSNQQLQAQITSTIGNTISNFADSLQGTSNAFLSNPQSQKSINQQVTAVQNMVNNDTISSTVQTTINNIVQNNGINFYLSKNQCKALNVSITQTNLNDYVIKSIVQQIMNNTFNTSISNAIQNTAKNTQTQKNSGLSMGLGIGVGVFIIIIIVLFFILRKKKKTPTTQKGTQTRGTTQGGTTQARGTQGGTTQARGTQGIQTRGTQGGTQRVSTQGSTTQKMIAKRKTKATP